MCECFQIGGPFIAEDPSCPIHGLSSRGREERLEGIVQRAVDGEITVEQAVSLIEEDYYS
jgi:hypothetical protein